MTKGLRLIRCYFASKMLRVRLRLLSLGAIFRSPETLRRQRDQPFAVQVEVDQSEGGQQPFVVLLQAPVSHLGKSEHALQDAKRPFHLGSYFGLGPVRPLRLCIGCGGRSYPAPRARPPESHLFAPDNLRRPTPSFPPRAVSQATYARRTHWLRKYTPNARDPLWHPHRCAPWHRKYHCCPLRVWCISGSRSPLEFLVDDGA
jgi:hypothetical protein